VLKRINKPHCPSLQDSYNTRTLQTTKHFALLDIQDFSLSVNYISTQLKIFQNTTKLTHHPMQMVMIHQITQHNDGIIHITGLWMLITTGQNVSL